MKQLFEFFPLIVFFAVYYKSDKDLYLSIAAVIVATFISLIAIYFKERKISTMMLVSTIILVVFGGLSIFLKNEIFFKMKPTLVYFLFGFVLLVGLLRGKSYLESLMGTMLPMEREGWMIISRRITGFFFFLGLLNEFVWRTFSTEVWVYFKTFGLSIALFVFLASQFSVLSKYGDFGNDDKK